LPNRLAKIGDLLLRRARHNLPLICACQCEVGLTGASIANQRALPSETRIMRQSSLSAIGSAAIAGGIKMQMVFVIAV